MRFFTVTAPFMAAMLGGPGLADTFDFGMADTADAGSSGVTGSCAPIPYCILTVKGVPGCGLGRSKMGGSCNSIFQHPGRPDPDHPADLDEVENCKGFKYGMEKTSNGNLWVYVWDSTGAARGVGIFDSCKDAQTGGRFCSIAGGGCHQLGS